MVRENEDAAWEAAARLYPDDARQRIASRMFMSQAVSSEHASSYALAVEADVHDERLWVGAPNRGIEASKLVGSVRQVAAWLSSCRHLGVSDPIVDLVPDPAEYHLVGDVLAAVA